MQVKIYKVTWLNPHTDGKPKSGYSLDPYDKNLKHHVKHNNSGTTYELPEGYITLKVNHQFHIYSPDNKWCKVSQDENNNPIILDGDKTISLSTKQCA